MNYNVRDSPWMNRHRRALVTLMIAAAALPARVAAAAAPAPRPGQRVVGYLSGGAGTDVFAPHLARFGYVEGRNLRFEMRIAPDLTRQPPERLAAELVEARPDALLVFSSVRTRLLFGLTRTIPIVTGAVSDPVRMGMARSLARPGGNVTGLSKDYPETIGVWIGLCRAILPRLQRIVLVVSPAAFDAEDARHLEGALRDAGVALDVVEVASLRDVAAALDSIRDRRAEAANFGNLPAAFDRSALAALARERRVVAMWSDEDVIEQGGLIGHWRLHTKRMERIMAILAKVLDGADPAGIPFELPDLTRCTVNLAAAEAIGVKLPEAVMLRATRVIG